MLLHTRVLRNPKGRLGHRLRLFEALLREWSQHSCGLTIDLVGNAQLSSELQWVIAVPLREQHVDTVLRSIDSLREKLEHNGLRTVSAERFDPAATLPNGTSIEPSCPYRPEDCAGEHLVATGHGLFVATELD